MSKKSYSRDLSMRDCAHYAHEIEKLYKASISVMLQPVGSSDGWSFDVHCVATWDDLPNGRGATGLGVVGKFPSRDYYDVEPFLYALLHKLDRELTQHRYYQTR